VSNAEPRQTEPFLSECISEPRHVGRGCRNERLPGVRARRLRAEMRAAFTSALISALARRTDGIFLSEFEQGEIGPDLFRKACEFGLERLVSKHRDRPYRGGRQKHWIKVKNRKHPAMNRVMDVFA
jgi:ATP-dependent DNA ligase